MMMFETLKHVPENLKSVAVFLKIIVYLFFDMRYVSCCLSDTISSSDMIKQISLIQQGLKRRELIVQRKEEEINKKLKMLGITKFNNPYKEDFDEMPTVYVITPTYKRHTQKADLTRLSQTLLHVPRLHWIVVEDSEEKSGLVSRFVENCGVSYTHLAVKTQKKLISKEGEPRWLKSRGADQRNIGLRWIREHFTSDMKGVVYFGDDDNTYDVRIFELVSYMYLVNYDFLQLLKCTS